MLCLLALTTVVVIFKVINKPQATYNNDLNLASIYIIPAWLVVFPGLPQCNSECLYIIRIPSYPLFSLTFTSNSKETFSLFMFKLLDFSEVNSP